LGDRKQFNNIHSINFNNSNQSPLLTAKDDLDMSNTSRRFTEKRDSVDFSALGLPGLPGLLGLPGHRRLSVASVSWSQGMFTT
jgi:hypothetical protein